MGSGQPLTEQRRDVVASENVGCGRPALPAAPSICCGACLLALEVPADHLIMVLSLGLSGHLLLSTGQFSRVIRIEMIAAITVGSAIPVDISKGARESAREWLMSGL